MAYGSHEKPAPPVRRTPSISVNSTVPNPPVRLTGRPNQLKNGFQAEVKPNATNDIDSDFPPPPPDFLISHESPTPKSSTTNTVTTAPTSLLEEIQRGGFKLRKTMIDRDRSAPRIR